MSRNSLSEWAVTVILYFFISTALVQAYVIPSGSMENTLLVGDHLLVDKLVYSPSGSISRHLLPYSEVKRGDIIVFRWPEDISQSFVKRVIGLPGDRLRLIDKRLILNGRPVDEPYVVHSSPIRVPYRDSFPEGPSAGLTGAARLMLDRNVENGELVVPPEQYFAMGDNRDNSLDSRYWGLVPRQNVIGKPFLIWWSYDAPGERLGQPGISLDHGIDLALHFFDKSRWERTLKLVRAYPIR